MNESGLDELHRELRAYQTAWQRVGELRDALTPHDDGISGEQLDEIDAHLAADLRPPVVTKEAEDD